MSLGQLNSLLFTLSVQPVVLPACGIFFFLAKSTSCLEKSERNLMVILWEICKLLFIYLLSCTYRYCREVAVERTVDMG